MDSKHDQMFLEILKEEKNVVNFLDVFFGFLYRCTDFYVEYSSVHKLGFPPRVAENLVLNALQKWKSRMPSAPVLDPKSSPIVMEQAEVPSAIQVVTVEEQPPDSNYVASVQPSECYNGAVRDNYTWSQTISDLDVLVNIPPCLTTAKDLRVDVAAEEIKVAINSRILNENNVNVEKFITEGNWTIIFNGYLSFKTRKDESIWSLVPGRHINIHLEKSGERWWEALLIGEPKIELNKIDCSRNLEELGATEQMKVQELMWNHQQKLLGKSTSEQMKMEKILKQAWDAEGSPFKGTPYDSSVLKFD